MDVDISLTGNSYRILSVNPSSEQDRITTDFFSRSDPGIYWSKALAFEGPSQDFPWTMHSVIKSAHDMVLDSFFNVLVLKCPNQSPDALLNTTYLMTAAANLWSAYFVQFASMNLRQALPTPITASDAVLSESHMRVSVDFTSAFAAEVLLGLIFVVTAYLALTVRKANNSIPKAPYSLAAQMSFLAGSRLVQLRRLRGAAAQRMSDPEMRGALTGFRLTFGWSWGPDNRKRFGIDILTADQELAREESKNLSHRQV
jgi:hypothetical protein